EGVSGLYGGSRPEWVRRLFARAPGSVLPHSRARCGALRRARTGLPISSARSLPTTFLAPSPGFPRPYTVLSRVKYRVYGIPLAGEGSYSEDGRRTTLLVARRHAVESACQEG